MDTKLLLSVRPLEDWKEWIEKRYIPEPNSGCWLWVGSVDKGGYARIGIKKKRFFVHRIVFSLLRGDIPAGLVIDHLCRVPSCINPQHMETVTIAENVVRGRSANRDKIACKRGHPLSGINLYIVVRRGARKCRTCQREDVRRYKIRKGIRL